jgi:hypothetical protein
LGRELPEILMRFAPLNRAKEAAQFISGVYIALDHRHGRVG